VRGAVLRERPSSRVVEVPHHVVPAPRTPRDEARRALGIPLDRPVAASLGVVTPAKRVGKVLEALASLPRERRPFLFVGGSSSGDDPLQEKVVALGLTGDVAFSGYLDDADFWRAASAADLAINLRHPTMGETSGAVCRLAGFGLPVVVSDVGWFRELPDSFAAKIPVGRGEVERLAAELSTIAFEPGEAGRRADAARVWAATKAPRHSAAAYAAVLEEAAAGLSGLRALAARLAAELWSVGVGRAGIHRSTSREPDAAVLAAVAGRAAGLIPRPSEEPTGTDPDRS
jgi:glycosyltransferase involved in cell wall biosynthesis